MRGARRRRVTGSNRTCARPFWHGSTRPRRGRSWPISARGWGPARSPRPWPRARSWRRCRAGTPPAARTRAADIRTAPGRAGRHGLAPRRDPAYLNVMQFSLTDLGQLAALPADTVIDVRSPAEFAEDHLPGAVNLPALSDAERARVGTIYVREDRFRARRIGAAL